MKTDILLALVALAVAIVGVLWDKPPKAIKILLIILAGSTSVFAIAKAISDDEDKKFMKLALITTLRPSNAEYTRVNKEVTSYRSDLGFEKEECSHGDDGEACFFYSPSDPTRRATLVLDSSEVARIYADEIAKDKKRTVAKEACTERYIPADLTEDFKAKVGILGNSVASELFRGDSNATYGNSFGVKIRYDANGEKRELIFDKDELKSLEPQDACSLFYEIENRFVSKFGESNLESRFPK